MAPASNTEILGLPHWADTDRFDVVARASGEAADTAMRGMVRTLLAERFGLRTHIEHREQPTYSLVVNDTSTVGPQLRRIDADCDMLFEAVQMKKQSLADLPRASNEILICATDSKHSASATAGSITTLRSGGSRMIELAAILGPHLGHHVVDKTGLDGFFEYTLGLQRPRRAVLAPPLIQAAPHRSCSRLWSSWD